MAILKKSLNNWEQSTIFAYIRENYNLTPVFLPFNLFTQAQLLVPYTLCLSAFLYNSDNYLPQYEGIFVTI